jgi:hypothetical protein
LSYKALFVKFVAIVRKKSAFGFFTAIRTKNPNKRKCYQTGKEHEVNDVACVCWIRQKQQNMRKTAS